MKKIPNYVVKVSESENFNKWLQDYKNNNLYARLIKTDYNYSVEQTNALVKDEIIKTIYSEKSFVSSVEDREGMASNIDTVLKSTVLNPEEAFIKANTTDIDSKAEEKVIKRMTADQVRSSLKKAAELDNPKYFTVRNRIEKAANNAEAIRKKLGMTEEQFKEYLKEIGFKSSRSYTLALERAIEKS